METKGTLNEKTISAIQELIEINIDSYNGAKQAADEIEDAPLRHFFTDLADQRVGQAVALQMLIIRNGEEPITKGSIAGRIHRAIMDWRSAFSTGPAAVLKEAERGEDYIKAKYEAALPQTAGSAVTDVLNDQYGAVKSAHDRVRDLRDSMVASD